MSPTVTNGINKFVKASLSLFYDKSDESRLIITFLMLECPFPAKESVFNDEKKKVFMHLSLEKEKNE